MLAPMRGWIKDYRSFKDKLSVLDNRRLEFDAERRAFHKLELRKVHQQQATDKADPELMGKLEAKSGDVAGSPAVKCKAQLKGTYCQRNRLKFNVRTVVCLLLAKASDSANIQACQVQGSTCMLVYMTSYLTLHEFAVLRSVELACSQSCSCA